MNPSAKPSGNPSRTPSRRPVAAPAGNVVANAAAGLGEIIYGRNPVREALRGRRRVRRAWVLPGRGGDDLAAEVASWAAAAGVASPPISPLPAQELVAAAGGPDHQGLVAEVDPYAYASLGTVLDGFDLVVALDRIQDPHNLGAIIRTAEVAGAAVIIPRHRTAAVTGAVVKASAGATEHAAVAQVRNLTDFLDQAKQAGFWTYGADAAAASAHSAQDYRGKTVFVVGSEGEGLGRRVAQA
ncbi:MAG TPA: RNA methyltransferase, partial [Thermoleophilia bacterium]|nr:RNA methyltransferase [Thermoleophilia bacterium]